MEFQGIPQLKRLKRAFVAYHVILLDKEKKGQISPDIPNVTGEIKLIEEWIEATQLNIERQVNK